MGKHKSGRFLIHELINPKVYVYRFDISSFLRAKPVLCVIMLWPDGQIEVFHDQLGEEREYFSFPVPLSRLAENDRLRKTEDLTSKPLMVKYCKVEGTEIYLGIEGKMFRYSAEDLRANSSLEGEAAAVYMHGIRSYFWPFSDYIRRDKWTAQELREFVRVHPKAENFKLVKERASDLFFIGQTPKLGRGQRSPETREGIQTKNYAIYNLVKSKVKNGNTIHDVINDISRFIADDFHLEDDCYEALRKAFDRSRKKIEAPRPIPPAYAEFIRLQTKNQDLARSAYLLLLEPAHK